MTKELLAQQITGREYPLRFAAAEIASARLNHLVIVYGASDDLMEFEGAIGEELGAPGTGYVTASGVLPQHDDCECRFCGFAEVKKAARPIEALWCDADAPATWTFKTDIPHATFDVMEDGEIFCRGIVFSLEDLK